MACTPSARSPEPRNRYHVHVSPVSRIPIARAPPRCAGRVATDGIGHRRQRIRQFVTAEVVTDSYAEVFGLRPVLGRWFTDEIELSAVISHALWQRRFHGDPNVLGRQIRSESQLYTIVAVAPPDFIGVFAPLLNDIWVPLRTRPALAARVDDPDQRPLFMIFGRFTQQATPVQVAAELNAIGRQRDALRTPEIGVRAALGASGGDIFRDVVAHGLRIVLIGVAAGEVLVFVATRALAAVQSNVGLPALRLYFIAGAIWIAIAFIATYAPAARAARISPLAAFRSE
jgi:hypothetical protein